VACNPGIGEGETCQHSRPFAQPDPCQQGTACLSRPDGIEVCTAAKACKADSDCEGNFGCTAVDRWDATTTYCSTRCSAGCKVGYGCAADGTSCELRVGTPCYVTDTDGAGCGTGAACSALTRVCTVNPPCNDDSDCAGYSCTDHRCPLNCTPAADTGLANRDMGCAPGFACNPQTLACSSTLGGACDPGSDDGKQCGVGGACSPASQKCVPATPCTSDDQCSGYGCDEGYCLLACTKNLLPCALGRTCNLDAHTCS
jgi:hypothetical protein